MARIDQIILKKSNFIFAFFAAFALAGLLANSFKSPDTLEQYFYIHPIQLLILFLAVSILLKGVVKYNFPRKVTQINDFIIFPLSIFITTLCYFCDYYLYEDFIFRNFYLNYIYIGYLALSSLLFLLITKKMIWWKKYWKWIIFLSFPLLFILLINIRLWSFDYFKIMVRDDHIIEWAQFSVLIATMITALLNANILHKKNHKYALIYLTSAVLFLIIAGEEISWGQRILNFNTPQVILEHNMQEETTIHNLFFLRHPTLIAYLIITAYGTFSSLLFAKLKHLKKNYKVFTVPQWFVVPYFLLPLIYYVHTLPGFAVYYTEWSEVCELLLYLGMFFFILTGYITLKISKLKSG